MRTFQRLHKRAFSGLLFTAAFLASTSLFSGGFPGTAQAASLQMNSVVGLNGYYSKDRPVPVVLHIVNPGPATSARLQVTVHQSLGSDRLIDGRLVWDVRLPAHQAVDQHIVVPGQVVAAGAQVVCSANGKTVSTPLGGNPFGLVSLVAVVSDKAQAAQFLTGSSNGQNGQPVLPVRIAPRSLPDFPYLLEDLTAVSITPETLSRLSNRQRAALSMWVKLGGLLLVTGVAPVDKSWQQQLPLRPSRSRQASADLLASVIDGSVPPPTGKVTISGRLTGEDTQVWVGTRAEPLIAARAVGRGMVVQTSFSPLQPVVLGWPGNATLWTWVIKNGSVKSQRALPPLTGTDGALNLATASDALPPLRVPSLRVWGTLFAVYALVVGPVLFFWLRRRKRESWAWIVLPSISLVTTVGIYGFGISQRPNGVLTEGVGVLELVGDGSAEAYGMRGFMSPMVTTASMTAAHAFYGLPLAETNVRTLGNAQVSEDHGVTAQFSEVGRWGVRYLYAIGAVNQQGQLNASLDVSLGTLSGMVSNATPYTLDDVALVWNRHLYELGTLRPGQSVTIDEHTKVLSLDGSWVTTYGRYNGEITHGVGRSLAQLLAAGDGINVGATSGRVMLVATCTANTPAIPELHTLQKIASEQQLTVVRQFQEVTPVFASNKVMPS
ncbi:hypothetical protein [Alicyclobacillus herbarius]|uniref:hypothetical protein n=1 Tax=Alicyclobacillus herbarius TaxID=122960 RepID=UPI00041FB983|nr:hypothetical protein [Alicyclobacillus herbarius]